MVYAAKAYKSDGRDSGYGKVFGGQKRKKDGAGKDEKEDKDKGDESKEKRQCYNCKSTQHLARSCPKN